jgi:hydroxyacylglutathione hydrolase
MDVRGLTVGPVQENCFLLRADAEATSAVLVDPGDEAERILALVEELGVTVEHILLTHTHFDHVGAVAPVARATGAPVTCPKLEVQVLQNVMDHVPWPGFGPYESWDPEHTVEGGERTEYAGMPCEVVFVPGHSPGHVAYVFDGVMASGDVLFEQSIGRTDLPGGDTQTLLRSIATLLDRFDDETVVLPGHMGVTTLGRERASNPFLQSLPA